MDILLIIAILASLAFMLLPALDHFASSETNARGLRTYLIRISRWTNE